MFGKPEWFRDKAFAWGLSPVCWQGWTYTSVWFLVIAAPFNMLLHRANAPGALIWIAASIAALIWDVRQIKRAALSTGAAASPKDSVLYIGDEDQITTKNLDMRLRK